VRRIWGISDEVLCLGNEQTYAFCQNVLDELMQIFPSKIVHMGGDEAPHRRWEQCPKCKAKMAELGIDVKKLQGYFTNRIEKFVNSKGRRILGWDEILDGDINQSAMVMSWRGLEPGIKAAHKGHDVIMSPVDYAYFDYYQVKDTWKEPLSIGGFLPVASPPKRHRERIALGHLIIIYRCQSYFGICQPLCFYLLGHGFCLCFRQFLLCCLTAGRYTGGVQYAHDCKYKNELDESLHLIQNIILMLIMPQRYGFPTKFCYKTGSLSHLSTSQVGKD